jgi:uncharacterized protein
MHAAPPESPDHCFSILGVRLVPLSERALFWPDEGVLVVSDLHLEKGSAYAARGQLLPPYDTHATLTVLEGLCERLAPSLVIALGDSFHDGDAADRLDMRATERIRALTGGRDWLWIEGNHDPEPPSHLGGKVARETWIGPLVFRHEPTGATGEVAGHLHPCAKVSGNGASLSGRSVRRACFVTDTERLILPALGAFTGGLNVCDPAFDRVIDRKGLGVHVTGKGRVWPIPAARLLPDRTRPR